MNIQEKINWLTSYIENQEKAGEIMDPTEKFTKFSELESSYDFFINENEFTEEEKSMSEVGLLNHLKTLSGEDIFKVEEDISDVNFEEKNSFNDKTLFIEEYKDYLIGKKIIYQYDNFQGTYEITDVQENEHDEISGENSIMLIAKNVGGKAAIEVGDKIETPVGNYNFQKLLDGELCDEDMEKVILILQDEEEEEIEEEIIEEKINKPEYRYYVVQFSEDKKEIKSGHEYREDAQDDISKFSKMGESDLSIESLKSLILLGIDPDDNSNWHSDLIDKDIIKLSIESGLLNNDFKGENSDKYYSIVISGKQESLKKSLLTTYLRRLIEYYNASVVFYEYEEMLSFAGKIQRVINELNKTVKKSL